VPPRAKPPLQTRDEIEALLLSPDGAVPAAEELPGLWMGDEIVEVDGQPVDSRERWTAALLAAWERAASGEENDTPRDEDEADDASAAGRGPGVTLTVRRGLVHPFASHPRLDLYVGASSPHPMSEFGCTVCHGGQGSATSFPWASHTPDSEADRGRWRKEHGWAANEFWLDPMRPARFAESACLKCHHQVVDLAASERFPQPPAAKLLRGYELVLQYGCFGCHDITGIADGRALGPDLRVEPSDSAAEQEHPGTLRRPGPSLRHLAAKLDGDFVRRWLADPEELRPGTRMPKSFGLLEHVSGELHAETTRRESVEMRAAADFLLAESQPLEYLDPSADVTASTAEEQAARGRELFQVSGCLVCHKHRDFEDADRFRGDPSVADGPDLSQLADHLRGPDARRWLTTWIKEPTRYDPRTVMPAWNSRTVTRRDAEGQVTAVFDPVADLVEYLLPRDAAAPPQQPEHDVDPDMLDQLVFEHLKREFPEPRAAEYRDRGIPMRLREGLKTAERDLVVADEQQQRDEFRLDRDVKLRYLGRKTVAWHGCYGCHEIPGFESTKPIGIELNDWGRKDPRMLAFEHVADYVAERIDVLTDVAPPAEYYLRHLRGGNRIGFLHQKLAEPRSFDFGTLHAKPWNDRLRMPQFRFSDEEREAVMTFVLGLVAQPPRPATSTNPTRNGWPCSRVRSCWTSTTAAAAMRCRRRAGRSSSRPRRFLRSLGSRRSRSSVTSFPHKRSKPRANRIAAACCAPD
jgi:mono/diheme cytochrome c family protein